MRFFITETGKELGYLNGDGSFSTNETVLAFEVDSKNVGRYRPVFNEKGLVIDLEIDEAIVIDEDAHEIVEVGQTIKDRTEMLEKENEALKQSQSEQDILLMQLLLGGN